MPEGTGGQIGRTIVDTSERAAGIGLRNED